MLLSYTGKSFVVSTIPEGRVKKNNRYSKTITGGTLYNDKRIPTQAYNQNCRTLKSWKISKESNVIRSLAALRWTRCFCPLSYEIIPSSFRRLRAINDTRTVYVTITWLGRYCFLEEKNSTETRQVSAKWRVLYIYIYINCIYTVPNVPVDNGGGAQRRNDDSQITFRNDWRTRDGHGSGGVKTVRTLNRLDSFLRLP